MSFVSDLRNCLINDEKIDDLSKNERFAEFNFIGLRETKLTLDLVSFTKADGLTREQISELCDRFFNITKIVSYDDFGLNTRLRNPNGLLCLVFEDGCPASLLNFIKKQTRISHWGKSAVIVSWTIDVKNKQIYTHDNPVSLIPPVVIAEWLTFPKLNYLKSFLNSYHPQPTYTNNDVEVILQSFRKLEEKVKETYELFKSVPRQKYENYFPDTKIVTVIYGSETYIKNGEFSKTIMNNTGDTYNVGQAGAVGRNARSDYSRFYQSEQKQSLAEAATEIQQLLEQLSQTYPTSTTTEKLTVVTEATEKIEKNPILKSKVVNALKTGGTEALKEAIDHPLVNILLATIEGWREAE